jgi:glycerate dehydrogenase
MIAITATGHDVIDVGAANRMAWSSPTSETAPSTPFQNTPSRLYWRCVEACSLAINRDGAWKKADQLRYFDYPIRDLSGSTLGITGGRVLGKAVADIGRAFGMRVLFSAYKGVHGMVPLYTPFHR